MQIAKIVTKLSFWATDGLNDILPDNNDSNEEGHQITKYNLMFKITNRISEAPFTADIKFNQEIDGTFDSTEVKQSCSVSRLVVKSFAKKVFV